MPYYTQALRSVPVGPHCPRGVAVDTIEWQTLAEAVKAPGMTGAIFSDELTYGRAMIRNSDGVWVAEYANPALQPSGQVTATCWTLPQQMTVLAHLDGGGIVAQSNVQPLTVCLSRGEYRPGVTLVKIV